LADKNDINSTEKLLNVIRGKQEQIIDADRKTAIQLQEELPAPLSRIKRSKLFSDKNNYTVGVDIGYDCIRLVKTVKASDGPPILIDQKSIKYDSKKVVKGSPEFNTLLRASLISFCGNPANCNIWAMMTAEEVNVNHIKVPRVQKKQLENAIYWSAKKETSFDEKDYIFDFELQGEISDQGIPKYSVMVYSAPKAEIEKSKAFFSNIGITLSGITIAPFVIQNIFRANWIPSSEAPVAALFIGNEFSRIDIFSKGNLVMTRGIKTGTSSMLEAITESILEKTGTVRLEKGEARKILFSLGPDSEKLTETDAGFDLKEDEIFKMIMPAIERLARQMERTLAHYTNSMGREKVDKLYISSTMNRYDPILHYISEQLGIKSEIFDPFKNQVNSHVAETINLSDRLALVPALGLSFSDNQRTPNLIFTYREKNKEISIRKINRGIIAAFAAALVICITTIIFQGIDAITLNKQKESLKRELSLYNPLMSADKITKLAYDVKMQRQISVQYAERYLGMAIIGEISASTPENIRLVNLKIITSRSNIVKDKTDKMAKEETDGITWEGLITGNRNMLDSYLAQYIMKLGNSPMLHQVTVNKSNIVNFKKNDVLQFTMSAKAGK
jgi:Tfp pilus assembly PilM family ATPase